MPFFKVYDTRRFAQVFSARGANYTDTETVIPGNPVYTMSANATLTLRDATLNAGCLVTVANSGALLGGVIVTVAAAAGQFVDGAANVLLAPKQSVTLVSDGTNWITVKPRQRHRNLVSKTGAYTVTKEDVFHANTLTCSGTFTVTLLSSASIAGGSEVTIKNGGAGTITVDTTSVQNIDGAATVALAANQAITVKSTGSTWLIIARVV